MICLIDFVYYIENIWFPVQIVYCEFVCKIDLLPLQSWILFVDIQVKCLLFKIFVSSPTWNISVSTYKIYLSYFPYCCVYIYCLLLI